MKNLIKDIIYEADDFDLMVKLKKFVFDCTYLTHKSTIERVQTYINCDCDTKRTAEKLCITTDTVRTSVWYANTKLKTLLGESITGRIKSEDPLAKDIMDFALEHSEADLLLPQVEKHIPPYNYRRYSLEDCSAELKFLKFYTHTTMAKKAEQLDKSKLSYIDYLLHAPSDTDMELSLMLRKNFSYKD